MSTVVVGGWRWGSSWSSRQKFVLPAAVGHRDPSAAGGWAAIQPLLGPLKLGRPVTTSGVAGHPIRVSASRTAANSTVWIQKSNQLGGLRRFAGKGSEMRFDNPEASLLLLPRNSVICEKTVQRRVLNRATKSCLLQNFLHRPRQNSPSRGVCIGHNLNLNLHVRPLSVMLYLYIL